MRTMFLVEVDVRLVGTRRLTDDEITDLIEEVVDDLDQLAAEPSVGTRRVDDDLELSVAVTIDDDEEFDALTRAVAAIKAALKIAGVVTTGLVAPHELRSRVVSLPRAS